MAEVRKRWGGVETTAEKVQKRRLEWLGHVARMPDHRIPKSILFSWLPQPRPRYGPRKRWRDVVHKDLKDKMWMRVSGMRKLQDLQLGGESCTSWD